MFIENEHEVWLAAVSAIITLAQATVFHTDSTMTFALVFTLLSYSSTVFS